MVTVTSNIRQVMGKYRNYPAKVIRPATSRSINDALTQTRTQFVNRMADGTNLPRAVARGSTKIKRSTARTLTGVLSASGGPVPIKAYGARKTNDGVRVKIKGKVWNIKGAFRLRSKGNHWFKRSGDKRMPIHLLTGPAIPSNVTEKELRSLRFFSEAKFAERMRRNVAFYLRRKLGR